MKLVLAMVALAALAGEKKPGAAKPTTPDANDVVAKTHGGKLWLQTEEVTNANGRALLAWLDAHPAANRITRATTGDPPWFIHFIAVFKKPAAKGPITVQVAEKGDPKAVIEAFSLQNDQSTRVFRASFELDPDRGFNRGRSYLVQVGQILKQQFTPYASATVTLQ